MTTRKSRSSQKAAGKGSSPQSLPRRAGNTIRVGVMGHSRRIVHYLSKNALMSLIHASCTRDHILCHVSFTKYIVRFWLTIRQYQMALL